VSDRVSRATADRVGLLGSGALLAVALALLRAAADDRGETPVSVVTWVADRDGCAIYGLDEDAIVARRLDVAWPIALAARPDGGVWVVSSDRGSPASVTRLLRLDTECAIRSETLLGECADLAALGDGSAIVLGSDRILRCDANGRVAEIYRGGSLTCCAASEGSVVVGDALGIVRRVALDPPGAVIAHVDLRERVLQIESDLIHSRFWVTTVSDAATIHRLDADLAVQWSAYAGSLDASLAKDADPDRIWIVDGARSTVRRFDGNGIVELERADPAILGANSGAGSSRGGIVVARPGCMLLLDPAGRILPGQGGFAHLVDVELVP
jgi:hypothetical protein